MKHPLLIDTETLEQNLGRSGLAILDVRGKAAYEFGGIFQAPSIRRGTITAIRPPWRRDCSIRISPDWNGEFRH